MPLYLILFNLFNKFAVAQDDTQLEFRANDSPVDCKCEISRQKTATTDTINTHTRAVSSADRAQCLALLVLTSTDSVDTTVNS